MRVQDIHGHWYEIDDALLAGREVKVERETETAKSPAETGPDGARPRTPAAGPTPAPGSAGSPLC